MKNTFGRIVKDTELGQMILNYIYKSRRNGNSFIIYIDSNSHFKAILEEEIDRLPENTIGVIDNGQFMPIIS